MEWFDITVPIRRGMPVYEGDPDVVIQRVQAIASGSACNLSRIDFGLHTGTHVDAPLHFIDGAAGVDALPLDALIGAAWVVDATSVTTDLDRAALQALDMPASAERLLFKTPNSRLWEADSFDPGFVGITEDGARHLIARGVRLVGADYLSIAPRSDPAPTHITLLAAGVVILEGLDLRGVAPGPYQLVCLPLLIAGVDGAPARALLIRE
jgi:arylformamidase